MEIKMEMMMEKYSFAQQIHQDSTMKREQPGKRLKQAFVVAAASSSVEGGPLVGIGTECCDSENEKIGSKHHDLDTNAIDNDEMIDNGKRWDKQHFEALWVYVYVFALCERRSCELCASVFACERVTVNEFKR